MIDDPEACFEYRLLRNITSHTYDEATTEKVAGSEKSFLKDSKSLLEALEKG
ncbi:MAG: nucleotidyltransferase substrate binding protein [bacterium]